MDILSIGPGGTIYAGSDSKGNITSTDGGVNWVGLGGETYAAGETDAHCFSAAGQIMTGTQQWGIKSWNGSSWSSMNTGLPTYGSLYP